MSARSADLQHLLAPAFGKFSELLARRFQRGAYTVEDAVRYTFCIALHETLAVAPEDVIFEFRHPTVVGAEIDIFLPSVGAAIEFKYDRSIPSRRNLPLPQKAGTALRDIFRLAQMGARHAAERIFVYVVSGEMAKYLSSPTNGLTALFDLRSGEVLQINEQYLEGRSPTLRQAAGSFTPCSVMGLFARSLPDGHELRVFAVHNAS